MAADDHRIEEAYEFYNDVKFKVSKPLPSQINSSKVIATKPIIKKKKPVKLAFRITALSISTVLAVTGGLAIRKWLLKGYIPDNFKLKGCYMSVDETFKLEKYHQLAYDFVLLNIPNWQEGITNNISNNLKVINDNNIPLGLLLDSNAESNLQAETEALRLLSIIEDKKISLPIIININNIDSKHKEEILATIINTLKAKNILTQQILLGGNEENLKGLSNQFNGYNKYVLSNKEKVTNDYVGGNFDTGIINDVNAYLEKSYLPDATISVNENVAVTTDKECLGVDVSAYQGKIDWEIAKDYINFAIIRVANFQATESYLDSKCQYNISECKRLGIPFGIYFFSTATDSSKAKEECHYLLNQLNQMGITANDMTYPIYIDIETKAQEEKLINHDQTMIDTIKTFGTFVTANGFNAGIYINQSMAKLLDYTDQHGTLAHYHRWIANYGSNNGYKPFGINQLDQYNQAEVTVPYHMHQITDQIVIPGIGKETDQYANATVDFNIDTSRLAFQTDKQKN